MSEASKINWGFEGSTFHVSVDPNADGEPVAELELNLGEVADEVAGIFKGDKKAEIEASVVSFEVDGASLIVKIDSNKDGEEVLSVRVNLGEAADEIVDAIF